jgi:OOP family OmpA-OmpF porin
MLKELRSLKGCPDTDNDGIADPDDECPDFAGTKDNKGCPEKDSDGDGVPDKIDKCPDSRGLRVYNGCPDSDGDGIEDSRDKCPDVPGTVATGGCPEITKEDKDVLNSAMRSVNFETGKSELLSDSKLILDKIADILNKYSSYDMIISGHTDDDGDEVLNQKLSESRAKACYDYLISKGVSITRLEYIGYGESKPIVPNKSDAKFLNRRVEFNLVTRK